MKLELIKKEYHNVDRVNSIGFSGHHLGIAVDIAAISLGAQWVGRHFTLDRTWKRTDHAASLEPDGMRKLTRDIHNVNKALTYNNKDILWCKEHITGSDHYYSEGHDDVTDLTLMRYCDHHIIANSSFSWWAAWLNNNPNKTIIAPKKWFGKVYNHDNTNDLIPNEWKVL